MNSDQLLDIVIPIGYDLLRYGAEVYRVEESIQRIGLAYGAYSIETFVIPSSIIVTIDMGDGDRKTLSKKVAAKPTDFKRIDKLNDLSRYICNNTPEYDIIKEKLKSISETKNYSSLVIYSAYAYVPAAFTLFFGGNFYDALISTGIGMIIKILLDIMDRFKSNIVFINIICSATSTVISMILYIIFRKIHPDKIIIGTIMLLVPGLILTNAMRDFITGDLIAGTLRIIEALLVATGIAIGVALVLSLFDLRYVGEIY